MTYSNHKWPEDAWAAPTRRTTHAAIPAGHAVATEGPLRIYEINEPRAFCDHLLRLSPADRYQRFGMCVTDDGIRRYGEEHKHSRGFVHAILTQDAIHGAIEARVATGATSQLEIGLTIERSWRGMGFGTELVRSALFGAQIAGFKSVVAIISHANRDMIAIARKLGAQMDGLGDCVAAEWCCSAHHEVEQDCARLRREPMPGYHTTVVALQQRTAVAFCS
jgi:RimJ/RimL family protein N-acetyltransferase